MRLDRLDLTRYGRFTDHSLSFTPPAAGGADLHIVYGPNEAGKSTLFSAWLDLLFAIPARTRYDFLHPGPTMQIGAQLSHAGGQLDLKRLKRNSGSLIDRHDTPLPEAVLQSALGGLSRDGYSAMFSLDDDTLERGGDSILANRGDLGEMLFSASAGLSGLAPQLETLRAGLDGFHRSGKRTGWLCNAKKQLTELDRQRRDIEVSANALQKLTREARAAEQEWREARDSEQAVLAELDRLHQLDGALPLIARLAALETQLAPLQHLPDAAPGLQADFQRIDSDSRDLANRIRDRALRLTGLREKLAALALDPEAIAQAPAIDAAETLRPEHDTALKDLPRRRDEAQDITRRMDAILAQLGQQGATPGDLCLPPDRIVAARALLALRSGVVGAVAAAAAETRKASDLLDRERETLGDPGPAEDEAALAALIARQRAQDPADGLARALRDRDQAAGRLQTAIAALSPWQGDAETLAALAIPAGWQITDWDSAQETARQQALDARRDAGGLRADLNRSHSDAAGREAARSATGITLADAATARGQREALWAAHLADLSAASARSFERALREDDRISALLAEAMAEARREALDQAARQALTDRLQDAESRLNAALDAETGVQASIAAACAALGLHGAALADLRHWLDLRLAALAERAARRDADTAVARSQDALDAACRALGAALQRPAGDPAESYESLLASAVARIQASDRRRDTRQRLLTLASDLRERQQAEKDTRQALTDWQQKWAETSKGSILADYPDDDAGLGVVVDLLDQLGGENRDAAALNNRIAKMDDNRLRFDAAQGAVLSALGLDATSQWPDVLARLRRAQDARRDHDVLATQIAQEDQADLDDQRALAGRDGEAAALGAALDWTAGDTSLGDHIALCSTAMTLRRDIAALQGELHDRPQPTNDQDSGSIRHDIQRLKADHQLLRNDTETRLAAHLEARRRIDEVGGDDTLARIAAERENLLLDIKDQARGHLAGRFGLIALETGLRRYRDRHRSAMLTRASDAFNRLSRGAYSGLAAQPDGTQEVLVALPAGGGAKLAADLSKGTRFQLYLALRIAGYHELAQSRPTVPFIADDIMETFDDQRSEAAFSLLGEMSRTGQVIYLTHHRHLCDIALAACPEANVIDLQSL